MGTSFDGDARRNRRGTFTVGRHPLSSCRKFFSSRVSQPGRFRHLALEIRVLPVEVVGAPLLGPLVAGGAETMPRRTLTRPTPSAILPSPVVPPAQE
jgi:hypothetical protein